MDQAGTDEITRLSHGLDRLDLKPPPFECSTIGGNQIGPNVAPTAGESSKQLARSTPETNPFYDSRLTLAAAAKHLCGILSAALKACERWLKQPVASIQAMVSQVSEQNDIVRMCSDFNSILYFLEHERRDWNLTYFPDNFFADVGAVLPTLRVKVEQISEIEGCEAVYDNGVVPLRTVATKLREIQALRKSIWEQSREEYELHKKAERVEAERQRQLATRPKLRAVSRRGTARVNPGNGAEMVSEMDVLPNETQEAQADVGMGASEASSQESADGAGIDFQSEVQDDIVS